MNQQETVFSKLLIEFVELKNLSLEQGNDKTLLVLMFEQLNRNINSVE